MLFLFSLFCCLGFIVLLKRLYFRFIYGDLDQYIPEIKRQLQLSKKQVHQTTTEKKKSIISKPNLELKDKILPLSYEERPRENISQVVKPNNKNLNLYLNRTCPACKESNPAGVKYCLTCGFQFS